MKKNYKFLYLKALSISLLGVMVFSGCTKKIPSQGHNSSVTPSLLLAQAQFNDITDENGRVTSRPGAAKLTIVHKVLNEWEAEILEDPESNVFHKALWFTPPNGQPGILTIGGNAASLKLWHFINGKWQGTVLWNSIFGGEQNRLRDIEVDDVTADGQPDLVIATHDQGIIAVLQWKEDAWQVTELNRTPNTFVHEIEIGDVNNDGVKEFFATPSAPNRLDGTPQPGKIIMYRFEKGRFLSDIVEEFPSRHVKELLVADVSQLGYPDLFAVIEGEMSLVHGVPKLLDTVKIKQYHWEKGRFSSRIIADLPDMLCRYLTAGDIDGDGSVDIVASTMKSGIWWLRQQSNGQWEKVLVDKESSSFEHATLITDLNNDGQPEIYVASDDQHVLYSYQWTRKGFQKKKIISLTPEDLTFGLNQGLFRKY